MSSDVQRPVPGSPTRPRIAAAFGVIVALVIQVALAVAMLFAPRPAPYGWQMYSAVPDKPPAWAVTRGVSEPIDVEAFLVHDRAEIDYTDLVRAHGCERTGADAIRIELADGSVEEVACR